MCINCIWYNRHENCKMKSSTQFYDLMAREIASARLVEAEYLDLRLFWVSEHMLIEWSGFSCPKNEFALRLIWAMATFLPTSIVYLQHPIIIVNPTRINLSYFQKAFSKALSSLPSFLFFSWRVPIVYIYSSNHDLEKKICELCLMWQIFVNLISNIKQISAWN